MKMNLKQKSALREWMESLVIAFVLAMVIRTFIIQPFKIPTGSMRPTLLEGDRIFVNKFIYGARIPLTDFRLPALRQPKRGDIIVFLYPENPSRYYIKRLAAVEGETIEIIDGSVYINGKICEVPDFKQRFYYNRGPFGEENKKIIVPAGNYFVLGDNSASSMDSRYWGFVPKRLMIGKAIFIFWPLNRIRLAK
jgi:signal peptidase I